MLRYLLPAITFSVWPSRNIGQFHALSYIARATGVAVGVHYSSAKRTKGIACSVAESLAAGVDRVVLEGCGSIS